MPTDQTDRSPHPADREILIEPEPPISVSHFVRVLGSYRGVILLALAGVALAYLIVALALYLASPGQQITSQSFRLDFEGAGKGEFPNKSKFNIADIISGPILARVWQDDHLGDYLPFGDFSRSVYVLESNREYDSLVAEYQAKLADTKLSPIDRERLQNEFEMKADSIKKNEYTINLDRRSIPEPIARKVLLDVLNEWADFAVNKQHVIAYQVSVLSPEILAPSAIEQADPVAAAAILRAKANRVLGNLGLIATLPGANLARTPKDQISLEETRIRVDEIMRFRLEPLLATIVHSPGLISDRATTLRFLESQLAYDQRQLDSVQQYADSIRDSITVYQQPSGAETSAGGSTQGSGPSKSGEALMPQLSDTFLDRLVTMTGRAGDAQYRQGLVDSYRKAVGQTIPLKEAVAYDQQLLDEFRKSTDTSAGLTRADAHSQVEQARADIAKLMGKMNELFNIISTNMTPATQLFTVSAPPVTRTVRAIRPARLALYGILVMLISIPVTIILCLLHNRIREEEAAEEYLRDGGKLAGAETLS